MAIPPRDAKTEHVARAFSMARDFEAASRFDLAIEGYSAVIRFQPTNFNALTGLARSLIARGDVPKGKQALRRALEVRPNADNNALTCLADLLLRVGKRRGARAALSEAVHVARESPIAHTNLAGFLAQTEPDLARTHYARALELDSNNRTAHCGLAILLLRAGEHDAARIHGKIGFREPLLARAEDVEGTRESSPVGVVTAVTKKISLMITWPKKEEKKGRTTVLFLLSLLGDIVPIPQLFDPRKFLTLAYAADFVDETATLPPHDILFNGVGDADLCSMALDGAEHAARLTRAPVLNKPSRVRDTARARNAERLREEPMVRTAKTELWSREALSAPTAADSLRLAGFVWPLLLRAPGFHTGEHFVKVEREECLVDALRDLPGDSLLVMEFIDTRSADGLYRKYRVMMIDGQLHPLHVAISPLWKVHYFSAAMDGSAEYRAEDDAFLRDMRAVLGPHLETLERIQTALGLDYGGVDFAIHANGELVVFEANATMILVDPGLDPKWAYRRQPVAVAKEAFERMVLSRVAKQECLP